MIKKIHLPLEQQVHLLSRYTLSRLWEQAKAFLPVVVYLGLFQILVLGQPLAGVLSLLGGITLGILGLSLFLEGLFLTFMPLGEALGISLPIRWPLAGVAAFSLILGIAATFAEPAIGILKAAGASLEPWSSPLLYYLLHTEPVLLVLSIAVGIGLAVVMGVLRFVFGWTLKTLLLLIIPILLVLTLVISFNPALAPLIGLAWDAGGIATGPVTVPMILALGIGVSQVVGKDKNSSGGFGLVTLANYLPMVTVVLLGWGVSTQLPLPMTQDQFFSPEYKTEALKVLGNEEAYQDWEGRARSALTAPVDSAPPEFSDFVSSSFQAVVPLTLLLFLGFFLVNRGKPRFLDEKILGVFLAFLGMTLFSFGVNAGLGSLGTQVGKTLPASFQTVERPDRQQVWQGVTPEDLRGVFTEKGEKQTYVLLESQGRIEYIPFDPERYDPSTQTYRYIPSFGPLFGPGLWGLLVVLVFGFLLGWGATLAEPALMALSRTVEEVTIGVINRTALVQTVAVGVGFGLALGLGKILFGFQLTYLLVGIYILLLVFTVMTPEEFVSIAYDSAGVTTGPVTVPLVVIIGMSLGSRLGVMDGFGVLATASAFPVLSVLILGLVSRARARRFQ